MRSAFEMFKEMDAKEPKWEDYVEAAFRRGFHHGVNELIAAIGSHLPPELQQKLRAYEERLWAWRCSKKRGFPPDFF